MFATAKQPSLLRCGALCVGEGTMQLSCSSLAPLSNELSCETSSFSHCGKARRSPQSALSLSFSLSQPSPCGLLPCCSFFLSTTLPVWLFCLTVFSISWLSEFHAVWFFCTSGCLLILGWLLSSFWLYEETKGFYLRLFGGNSELHSLALGAVTEPSLSWGHRASVVTI